MTGPTNIFPIPSMANGLVIFTGTADGVRHSRETFGKAPSTSPACNSTEPRWSARSSRVEAVDPQPLHPEPGSVSSPCGYQRVALEPKAQHESQLLVIQIDLGSATDVMEA